MAAKVIERCSTAALCSTAPYIATGTVAGAFDVSFSTTSTLEIFSLDFASPDPQLPAAGGAVQAPERFNRLAWGTAGMDGALPYGMVAGGLADGSVVLWNPASIIGTPTSSEDVQGAVLAKMHQHNHGVKGLAFNTHTPNLLASGGGDGDLCIWDVANPNSPSLYPAMKAGAQPTAGPEVAHLAWNNKVQHILATCTVAGTVVVWDLKKQRPVITLRDSTSQRRGSSVAWNPEVATQLVVASDDDSTPSLQLWDLRYSMAPVKEFHGHTKGVLSVSWCTQDPVLLLSSGKDSRTLCWDTSSGAIVTDTQSSQWNFDVQWSLRTPGVFATSCFDGKVTVNSITSCTTSGTVEQVNADFSVSHVPAAAATPLTHAPAWLKRPAACAWGFGGKLSTMTNVARQLPTGEVVQTGQITVQQVVTEAELVMRSEAFERAIRPSPEAAVDRHLLKDLCATKAAGAGAEVDRETWQLMGILFEEEARRQLLMHLGFGDALPQQEDDTQAAADAGVGGGEYHGGVGGGVGGAPQVVDVVGPPSGGVVAQGPPPLPDGDGIDFFNQEDNDNAFFNDLPPPPDTPNLTEGVTGPPPPGAPAAAAHAPPPVVAGEGEAMIERALTVGNYSGAVDECIKVGRIADALLIASIGGEDLWRRAQQAYMQRAPAPYMQVVQAVLEGNLAGLIATRPLSGWRETLAILATYAGPSDWQQLCDSLGNKLAAAGMGHEATLCFICAGNVNEAVSHWGKAFKGRIPSVDGLQALMEKAVVMGIASGQRSAAPALSDLVDEYVGILAAQGRAAVAWEYLEMLPGEVSTATAILKDRLYRSGAPDLPPTAHAPHFPFEAEEVTQQSHALVGNGYAAQPYGHQQQQQAHYQQQHAAPPPAYHHQQQQQQQQHYQPQPPKPATFTPAAPAPTYDPYNPAAGGGGGYGAPPPPPPVQQQQPQPPQPFVPQQPAYQPPPPQQQQQPAAPTQPHTFVPQQPTFQPTAFAQAAAPEHHHPPPPPVAHTAAFKPAQAPEPPKVFAPAAAPQPNVPSVPSVGAPPPVGGRSGSGAPGVQGGPVHPPPAQQQQPPQQAPPAQTFAPTPNAMFVPPAPVATQPAYPGAPPPAGSTASAASTPKASAPAAPAAPPANITIATVDTSQVPASQKPIVASLTSLYNAVAPAAAAGPKKKEMDDNSKRLGQLFWKLNAQQVSEGVVGKLQQLCAALDAGNYATASHIQINLTTSDWSECSAWLTALKRLVKSRQALG